jgi:hypothetical protein
VLFDLQSPRRRRVVRVVFGGLAAVFAISFVGFGVGTGGGSGGFLNNLFGGGGGSSSSAFDGQISAAEKALATNPSDTAAQGQLVQLHYSAALQDASSSGQLNSDGVQHLRQGADAWNKYVKSTKGDVTPTAALYALQTFDQLGSIDFQKARSDTSTSEALLDVNAAVSDWKSAAQAQQILILKEPKKATANSYARLASYLYLSGQTQAGNRATAQATQKGGGSAITGQLKPIQALGQQLQTAITQLTKQQQTQGAAGGAAAGGGAAGAGSNPLGGLSGGGTSGFGGQ